MHMFFACKKMRIYYFFPKKLNLSFKNGKHLAWIPTYKVWVCRQCIAVAALLNCECLGFFLSVPVHYQPIHLNELSYTTHVSM